MKELGKLDLLIKPGKVGLEDSKCMGKWGSSNVVLRIRWISPTRGPILESVRKKHCASMKPTSAAQYTEGCSGVVDILKGPHTTSGLPAKAPPTKKAHTNPQPSPPTAHLSRKGVGIRKAV